MSFEVSIPILIEKVKPEGEPAFYRTLPVFFKGYERIDPREDRAVRHLRDDLRKGFNEVASELRHDLIAGWSYHPKLSHRRLNLTLTLRKHTLRTQLFVVLFEAMERTLVACPRVAEVCFELCSGESLEQRAHEVYTEHFRRLEKDGIELTAFQFDELVYSHLDSLSFTINTRQKLPKDTEIRPLAFLGMDQDVSGSQELERTGRCLNRLYPNELGRALTRDKEVQQLRDWFDRRGAAGQTPPPLLIVGPNQVGKTTLIHEWVYQMCQEEKRKKPDVWLLSPQRLISGMSYLGQWEERVLAILEHVAKEKHILYFDDLIGLFHAGKSRDSNLTVGQVLKLHLEESKVRVVAETTPAAWRKLREVDRAFADLFTVIHLREPAETETLKILIRTMQDLEPEHHCEFSPEVLPLVVELPRRFIRGRAFPGKGAEMLRQLASTHPDTHLDKETVYRFFENKTGIRQRFMDRQEVLETTNVEYFFRQRIVGQDEAIQAMVDAIVLAKAQLNDPDKPVASMLFLGPTGVGKTECAKTLAEYYFGTPERLLRFDMNEFNSWDAIDRLIGTFGGRQGVLTGAVRRRPHAVILLDEIEKAHPDVLDLLLQVLDDGRLTDANGVTADFCNAIIILTSNLGARDAKSRVGFGAVDTEDVQVYREAARRFFRPEFFNRLDKVVAFHELGREHIEGIVRTLVSKALRRQGFYQRQLSISLDREVFDLLADQGFQKEFGARALRRAVEDFLIEPLAVQLAKTAGREPGFLRAFVHDNRVQLSLRQLQACPIQAIRPSRISAREALEICRTTNQFVRRKDQEMDDWRESDAEHLTQLDQHYFHLREELIDLRQAREKLQTAADSAAQPGARRPVSQPSRFGRQPKQLYLSDPDTDKLLSEIFLSSDSQTVLEKLAEQAVVLDGISHQANQLILHAARIEYLANPHLAQPDRVLIRFHVNRSDLKGGEVEGRFEVYKHWVESYIHFFQNAPATSKKIVLYDPERNKIETDGRYTISNFLASDSYFLYGEGPGFREMMEQELGLELFCFAGQAFEYGGIEVLPLNPRESLLRACQRITQARPDLMDTYNDVFRVRHENGWVLDLKSGILTRNPKVQLWNFLMPLLNRPDEFAP